MIELLSGTIVWLWDINGTYFDDQEQAAIAAKEAHVTLDRSVMVQALKQKSYDDKDPPNYYLIKKINISNEETLRKSGLAKLTPMERKALGL